MAVLVAAEAMTDSGRTHEPMTGAASERGGVFFATSYGNLAGTIAFLQKLHDKGPRFASPLEFPNLVLSAPTGTLSIQFGLRGELVAFNQADLAGVQALCAAYEALSNDRLDLALCVAAEEKSAARDVCSPARVLGEGGGAVVLEAKEGSVVMAGAALAGGRHALADAMASACGGAAVDVVIGTGEPIDLAERIGYIDGHGVIDAAYAAHLVRSGEARSVVVCASEPGNAAAVWITHG
jgi:3-oxoacyl-[acyl-carrier-protein] synthase II